LIEVDKIAKEEYRNRSELLREALRRYVLRKQFSTLTSSLRKQVETQGFKSEDVDRFVSESRG
jgi:metal-responsive CopG/Arc/MetJ family transcriptional regulator